MNHPDGTKPFLRLREESAFLFLNRRRVAANPMREKINRADDRRHDGEGEQRQLPIDLHHDAERAD